MKKQTILITGAGSGLGKGTAIGLAKEGHKIIAAVHTWEQMSRFKEDLKDSDLRLTRMLQEVVTIVNKTI